MISFAYACISASLKMISFAYACISASLKMVVDGTFSSVPSMFVQLVTIHALIGGRTFPVVYSLLGYKAAASYKVMWEVYIRIVY